MQIVATPDVNRLAEDRFELDGLALPAVDLSDGMSPVSELN